MNRLNQDLANFRAGCEDAPEGTYIPEKQVHAIIGAAMDEMISKFREMGFPVCNSDGAHAVEATIFDWVRQTQRGEFESLIGLGGLDRSARAHAIDRLVRDRDFLSMRSL